MSNDAESRRVKQCELCKGNGIIPVRLKNGARSRVEVIKSGVEETVAYKSTGYVRCRCTKGERFQKNFALFDHNYCVSAYPGGEELAEEVGADIRQTSIPF